MPDQDKPSLDIQDNHSKILNKTFSELLDTEKVDDNPLFPPPVQEALLSAVSNRSTDPNVIIEALTKTAPLENPVEGDVS
jgi:hypothetical protein